jgi:hypothetical protein
MAQIDDGGAAFPRDEEIRTVSDVEFAIDGEPGMSLRDYFAAHAMQAILHASLVSGDVATFIDDGGVIAEIAYNQAEAMLEEREDRP